MMEKPITEVAARMLTPQHLSTHTFDRVSINPIEYGALTYM